MFETTVGRLNDWTESLEALTCNLQQLRQQLRRDGVTAMSRNSVRQTVSTRGVRVPPSAFDRLLDQAIERAEMVSFVY